MPNWMLGRFALNELALIWCLQAYGPNRHPPVWQIAEDTGLSIPSIHRLMRALEQGGVLRRVPRHDKDGTQLTNSYQVLIWDEGAEARTRGKHC